jgi:hypothetical protein
MRHFLTAPRNMDMAAQSERTPKKGICFKIGSAAIHGS